MLYRIIARDENIAHDKIGLLSRKTIDTSEFHTTTTHRPKKDNQTTK